MIQHQMECFYQVYSCFVFRVIALYHLLFVPDVVFGVPYFVTADSVFLDLRSQTPITRVAYLLP